MFGFIGEQPWCHPKISHNTITSHTYGIDCYDSTTSVISKNTISSNSVAGIRCTKSNPTILDNIIISNGEFGIYFDSTQSKHNIIKNNTCSNNNYGIYFWYYVNNNIIKNNNISFNNKSGIFFKKTIPPQEM